MNKIKKYIGIALFTMIAFFALHDFANAQQPACPTGYNTVTMPIYVGGCLYEVALCYTCGSEVAPATYLSVLWVKKVNTPPCNNGMTWEQVIHNIYTQISEPNYLKYVIGCDQQVPPCGTLGLTQHTLKQSVCWKKVLEADGFVKCIACDTDRFCTIVYEYCWDSVNQRLIEHVVSCTITGNGTCQLNEMQAGEPTVQYPETSCFHILTECDYPH
jgi:hypothetical protein